METNYGWTSSEEDSEMKEDEELEEDGFEVKETNKEENREVICVVDIKGKEKIDELVSLRGQKREIQGRGGKEES